MGLVFWLLMVLVGLIAVYGRVGLLFSVDCLLLCGYYLMVGLFGLVAGWVFGGWFVYLLGGLVEISLAWLIIQFGLRFGWLCFYCVAFGLMFDVFGLVMLL